MDDLRRSVLPWQVRVVAAAAAVAVLLTAGMAALVQVMVAVSHIGFHRDPASTILAAGRATGGPLLGCLALGVCAVWGILVAVKPGARVGPLGWVVVAVTAVVTTGVAGTVVHEVWLYEMGAGSATHLLGRAPLLIAALLLIAAFGWVALFRLTSHKDAGKPRARTRRSAIQSDR